MVDLPTRTAVVVVHGMGEQLPTATLANFAKTAIGSHQGQRWYFSRPDNVDPSFEARCYRAYRRPENPTDDDPLVHGDVDMFEYHWAYKMTGNRFSDVLGQTRRLLVRAPWTVPAGLRGAWALVWLTVLAGLVAALRWRGQAVDAAADPSTEQVGLTLGAVLAVVAVVLVLRATVIGAVTRSFVDVVRYLDNSPRSYNVRRDIRGGLVDLLIELHNAQRYNRVVVVAHSLGGYIAYDALTAAWPLMSRLHARTPGDDVDWVDVDWVDGLDTFTDTARGLLAGTVTVEDYRDAQYTLWKSMRARGNPWLVSDLITCGTPMYFADLLRTRNRAQFRRLTRISELPTCPPQSGKQTVEGARAEVAGRHTFGHVDHRVEVLNHDAVFAVTRWTNLFFPAAFGFFGDWFGGRLTPLFGPGISDIAVTGNRPQRFLPAVAHSKYFNQPHHQGPDDVATVIQRHLHLTLEADDCAGWQQMLTAPTFLTASDPQSPLKNGQ